LNNAPFRLPGNLSIASKICTANRFIRFRIDIATVFMRVTIIGKPVCAIIVLRSIPLDPARSRSMPSLDRARFRSMLLSPHGPKSIHALKNS
jgi:hypothetical protein